MKPTPIPALLLLTLVGGAGCQPGYEGTYSLKNPDMISLFVMSKIELKGGGRAYITSAGGTHEVKYRTDGNKVIIENEGKNLVLIVEKDGSLSGGPLGASYKKVAPKQS